MVNVKLLNTLEIPDRVALLEYLDLSCKDCAEIGVLMGHFAEKIYDQAPRSLSLIDPWNFQPSWTEGPFIVEQNNSEDIDYMLQNIFNQVLLKFDGKPGIKIIRTTSADAAKHFIPAALDFAYIDANHAYKYIQEDLKLWWPKVKSGGYLAGHDYGPECPDVLKAVDEFLAENKLTLFAKTLNQEEFPSFCIRKP